MRFKASDDVSPQPGSTKSSNIHLPPDSTQSHLLTIFRQKSIRSVASTECVRKPAVVSLMGTSTSERYPRL